MYALTYDLHKENDPENAQSEHERMFTKQGIPTKALKARIDPSFVMPKVEEPDEEDMAEEELAADHAVAEKAKTDARRKEVIHRFVLPARPAADRPCGRNFSRRPTVGSVLNTRR